jgi:glutamine cyclotransferase
MPAMDSARTRFARPGLVLGLLAVGLALSACYTCAKASSPLVTESHPRGTLPASTQTPPPARAPIPVDGFEVVATYAHDAKSFTQGLVYEGGRLLESQGEYGNSSLRTVELESGKVARKLPLDARYFAEGLAVLKGLVYQLTWKEGACFVYTLDDLRVVGTVHYGGEGWGLTTDGTQLILSDGSDVLRFYDTKDFQVAKTLSVTAQGKPQTNINELEWVHGEIWANIWHAERIARIDPKSGEITRWIDLSGLLPASEHPGAESVLNGIAWDAKADRVFVTGKFWPKLFEIKVKPKG